MCLMCMHTTIGIGLAGDASSNGHGFGIFVELGKEAAVVLLQLVVG